MNYWMIQNDTIINCVVWDGETVFFTDDITLILTDELPNVNIGWVLVDGLWTSPDEIQGNDDGA